MPYDQLSELLLSRHNEPQQNKLQWNALASQKPDVLFSSKLDSSCMYPCKSPGITVNSKSVDIPIHSINCNQLPIMSCH